MTDLPRIDFADMPGSEKRLKTALAGANPVERLIVHSQLALEQDCATAGAPDPYVFQELAELYTLRGQTDLARRYGALSDA